jgi:hypothetical protein
MATTESKEWNQESKKHPTSEGLNPHITGSTGLRRKRGRRKESTLFQPTCPRTSEDWKKRGTVPRFRTNS